MIAYKCDICGKLYESPKDNHIDCISIKTKNILNYSYGPTVTTLDVCNECMNSFNEWMQSRHN
jgi:hypothetical protein